jgi:hypothetical protein
VGAVERSLRQSSFDVPPQHCTSRPPFSPPAWRTLSTVTLLLTLSGVSKAQDSSPIVTDRPDVTESAIVVPQWSLQVENGITSTLQSSHRMVSGTESLVRLGVAPGLELRFGAPDYFLNLSTGRLPNGFNDISVGFKQQVGARPGGIELSIIAAATLPTGTRGITTGGVDPFFKLPWSKELLRGWSIGGMQSFFWTSRNGYRNTTWEPTFYAEKELTTSWAAFVEYAGDYSHSESARQLLHVGTMYRLGPRQQIDAHAGVGLSTGSPRQFVAVGYSFRFDLRE